MSNILTTVFNMTKDVAGYNGFGVQPTNTMYGVQLVQNVAQSIVLPNNYSNYLAIFSYTPGTNVFVAYNGNVAAAFTGTIGNVTSELNPIARQLLASTNISLFCPDTNGAYVGIIVYTVNPYGN